MSTIFTGKQQKIWRQSDFWWFLKPPTRLGYLARVCQYAGPVKR